jgi:hypothetical protein
MSKAGRQREAQRAARLILGSHFDQAAQDAIANDWERAEGAEFDRGFKVWMAGVGRLRMGAETGGC